MSGRRRRLARGEPAYANTEVVGARDSLSVRSQAILDLFTPQHPVLDIADIADKLGMRRFAARRDVSTLVGLGYLERDLARRYRLAPRRRRGYGLRIVEGGGVGKRPLTAPAKTLGEATSASAAETQGMARRLVGVLVPSVALNAGGEPSLDLREFSCGYPLVAYFYPGGSISPESERDIASMDAVQHRAFRDHQPDLEARGYRVVGVSSQDTDAQRRSMMHGRLTQRLLSDPGLQLADRLQLPTFTDEGVQRYCRLSLVVHDGRIVKVFFPVSSAERSAAQVIGWMMIQGIS